MGDAISKRTVVRNPRFRHSVEVVREWPDLDALGNAGARMKLDLLLLKPEGLTPEDCEALTDDEIEVLRAMATREDPTFGVTHQVAAIGALAETGDAGALLLLADRARDRAADDRVRIAAIHALGEIGGAAVDTVVGQLIREKQPSIRTQAVLALAKVGTAADIAKLEQVADEGDDLVAPLARKAADTLRARVGLG
jgi:HEAT repeat protein